MQQKKVFGGSIFKNRASEFQIQNLRRKAQKQFTQLGTYASRAQRDMDNARMNHIAKKNESVDEEDDLDGDEELENSGPDDDIED